MSGITGWGGPRALQELGGTVSHPAPKPGLQEHQLPSPPPSWQIMASMAAAQQQSADGPELPGTAPWKSSDTLVYVGLHEVPEFQQYPQGTPKVCSIMLSYFESHEK